MSAVCCMSAVRSARSDDMVGCEKLLCPCPCVDIYIVHAHTQPRPHFCFFHAPCDYSVVDDAVLPKGPVIGTGDTDAVQEAVLNWFSFANVAQVHLQKETVYLLFLFCSNIVHLLVEASCYLWPRGCVRVLFFKCHNVLHDIPT